jgi:hypothetical protein
MHKQYVREDYYRVLLSMMQSDFAKYFKLTVCHVITCFHIMCCELLNRLCVIATITLAVANNTCRTI